MPQGWGHRVDCGDVDKCFESGECDHMIEGTCKMGGQEHFYLEPHGSIVVPGENDEIKIIASTQVLTAAAALAWRYPSVHIVLFSHLASY